MTKTTEKRVHEGRNIKRFREMLGIKQEALAWELGDLAVSERNQKKVSLMEAREQVNADLLARVSEILKIPVEAFQNFDEEQAINIISNTFHDEAFIGNSGGTYHINPIEEIRKLHEEKMALYERMLKEKDEMMERLERLIEKQ